MKILAIDPGATGAIVEGNENGYIDVIRKMPATPKDLLTYLSNFKILNKKEGISTIIEDVGHSLPGNSAKSSYTFALHRGHLEMAIIASGLEPVVWISPNKWMRKLGIPPHLEHSERKQKIFEYVQKRYPSSMTIHKYSADAVAIFIYRIITIGEVMNNIKSINPTSQIIADNTLVNQTERKEQ
jgi:hypothetical protein